MNSSIDRPTIEQVLSRHYPIEIHFIAEDDESGYYFAFLPTLVILPVAPQVHTGRGALTLSEVKGEVVRHYLETGKAIPSRTWANEEPVLQQMPVRVPKDIHDRLSGSPRILG